jgi:hypothetical protein
MATFGNVTISGGMSLGSGTAPAVIFIPEGGVLSDTGQFFAGVSIECSQDAVWTYTGGGPGGGVSIPSGSTATIISFSVTTDFMPRSASWNVSATSGGVTELWTVNLEVFGNA